MVHEFIPSPWEQTSTLRQPLILNPSTLLTTSSFRMSTQRVRVREREREEKKKWVPTTKEQVCRFKPSPRLTLHDSLIPLSTRRSRGSINLVAERKAHTLSSKIRHRLEFHKLPPEPSTVLSPHPSSGLRWVGGRLKKKVRSKWGWGHKFRDLGPLMDCQIRQTTRDCAGAQPESGRRNIWKK